MYKIKSLIFLLVVLLSVLDCNNPKSKVKHYQNQIGDTPFNSDLDSSDFKFCDSTNVLHKRALVTYDGGIKALEEELIDNYHFKTNYNAFSGYFIIRFAVNCNDESGRFRMEIIDSNFKPTNHPKELEDHILKIFKNLKHWNHAIYDGKDYDCYKFLTLKMEHGKLIKS